MINKTLMISLLGRPLSALEDTNFNLYLNIANTRLNYLLGISDSDSDERIYKSRIGYSEIKTDPFTTLTSVKVNGDLVIDYLVKNNDNYSATWFNSIEFSGRFTSEDTIEVIGDWGFGACPADLQFILARLFNLVSTEKGVSGQIKSKSIEDVSITFDNSVSPLDSLKNEFLDIIAKYSSSVGYTRSGGDGLTSWETR